MKGFILAAGYGNRLKPLTDEIPKPLVSVWGTPMIENVISKLERYDINKIGINLFHLGENIESFVRTRKFHSEFKFFYEKKLLDTGGGIKNAKDFLSDDDFIVHNSDILTDFNLSPLIDFHLKNRNDVTLAVMERDSSRKLAFNADMAFSGWTNLNKNISDGDISGKKLLSFTGIHIASPRIFDFIPEDDVFGIFDFYIKNIKNLKISGYRVSPQYWFDIGSIEKLNSVRDIKKID
jgi:NDP-sugar pyrophosphorylase family protein